MTPKDLVDWLIAALALIGLGIALGAGLVVAAGAVKAGLMVLQRVSLDAIVWRDLREAVDEWKERHPDKAERYGGGGGPWRYW